MTNTSPDGTFNAESSIEVPGRSERRTSVVMMLGFLPWIAVVFYTAGGWAALNFFVYAILVFAAGLIEAFLLWTLWNFLKAGRRKPARGGAWKINEGQKTRRAARPFQDLPAAAYSKPAANDEKLRSIRASVISVR